MPACGLDTIAAPVAASSNGRQVDDPGIVACTFITPSWDTSESRTNSFPKPYEEALSHIESPLRIEVHLAPEDPRRVDLNQRTLSKLRRVMPKLHIDYVSNTSIGLFEQTNPHYGDIHYELNGQRRVGRATTAEGVLDTIFEMAGVSPRAETESEMFRGHPLAVPPKGAALVFYGIWPAVMAAGLLVTGMPGRRFVAPVRV